ncbi:BMP family ABC transporter substrate-binding protein [uncultured Ilyobacter sp.]|uniref:BMP family lipoprotein n=1 Tax=uncultured Ilyobacter sp. TaxID=544433 RepID=UPI0029F56D3F|nr:BMP family ABC transporter substrate-binding protein [uncultured Ilyobacter sp.]
MKKIFAFLIVVMMLALTACGGKEEEEAKDETLKVGIVLSIGGLGDKSFNDSAYRGLEQAKKDLGIEFKYVEPASPAEDDQFLREFAEAGYDLVVATGFLMKDATEKMAKEFPDVKFAIIDEVIELPNVSSLVFSEDEGSFLVGALAAMMSETNTIGFVGGMEVPLIKKFQRGYEMGARYVNPDIKVLGLFTSGPNPFNDPVRGKENALSLIKQGADVVYHAAGGTGVGVIDAAKEAGVYAIGVDSNQDNVAPGTVLTSMIKNVDVAVYDTVKQVLDNDFKAGINRFGVAEGGVGTSDFANTKDVIGEEKLNKLSEIKEKIINGEIKF